MTYTHRDPKAKTLAELKEIAAGIEDEAVQGYSQMNKEHLRAALRRAQDRYARAPCGENPRED